MQISGYSPAIQALYRLAPAEPLEVDYHSLGLRPADMAALAEVAVEESEFDDDNWISYHAVRAFEVFPPGDALPVLVELLRRGELNSSAFDAWLNTVIDMGEVAKPFMLAQLRDKDASDDVHRTACEVLGRIAKNFPAHTGEIYGLMVERLEHFKENDRALNAFLIADLSEHDAHGHAALIERAFAAGKVDVMMLGPWERCSLDLGLPTTLDHDRAFDELTAEELEFLLPEARLEDEITSTGRNEPCPCGSGKKVKKCHAIPAVNPDRSRIQKLSAEMNAAFDALEKFLSRDEAVPGAIERFLGKQGATELPEGTSAIFMMWSLLHDRATPGAQTLVEQFLTTQDERRLRHAERLRVAAAEPFSFWQVRKVDWKRSLVVRDLLRGGEVTLHDEEFAGEFTAWGRVFYGQLVTVEGMSLLAAMGAQLFPPSVKPKIGALRQEMGSAGPVDARLLIEKGDPVRSLYWDLLQQE